MARMASAREVFVCRCRLRHSASVFFFFFGAPFRSRAIPDPDPDPAARRARAAAARAFRSAETIRWPALIGLYWLVGRGVGRRERTWRR